MGNDNRGRSSALSALEAVHASRVRLRVVDDRGTVATLEDGEWRDVAGFRCTLDDSSALFEFAQGRSRSLTFAGTVSTEPRLIALFA